MINLLFPYYASVNSDLQTFDRACFINLFPISLILKSQSSCFFGEVKSTRLYLQMFMGILFAFQQFAELFS